MRDRLSFERELSSLMLGEVSKATTKVLPLILAGPIVRRAAADGARFWFACSKNVKACKPSITPYDDKGKKLYANIGDGQVDLDESKGGLRVVRLGENIWVVLVSAISKGRHFPDDIVLGYDLSISIEENG